MTVGTAGILAILFIAAGVILYRKNRSCPKRKLLSWSCVLCGIGAFSCAVYILAALLLLWNIG